MEQLPSPEQPAAPQHHVSIPGRLVAAAVLLMIFAFAAGILGSYLYQTYLDREVAIQPAGYDGNAIVSKQEQDIASVAEKVAPSVVSILAKQTSATVYGGVREQTGAGTGVVISKDGYILTNNHVIEGASDVMIIMADGTSYDDVKVIGRDPLNDIAFVKIQNVDNLTPAQLGDSKTARIGQTVVAIGNALGQYENTVTSGIISGTGRTVTASVSGMMEDAEDLSDLIQTDAAINSGNSGGPLVNMAGQVIGINTAIASDANSVGFVIPISSAKGVISSVLTDGKVSRAYVGVRFIPITPDVAKEYKLSAKQGAYVIGDGSASAVVKGGPADKAGIRDKDVITKVNGVEVGKKGSVSTLVGEYKVGDTIELTVLRDGKTLNLKVTLAAYTN